MRQEKLLTFIKISELYQAFMHTFFCQNALILSNHKFFAKKINIIWSGSINYLQARHFKDMFWDKMSRKIRKKNRTISRSFVLNCFNILVQNVSKLDKKNF